MGNKIEDSLIEIMRCILIYESALIPSSDHWYQCCCITSGVWSVLWWPAKQILWQLLEDIPEYYFLCSGSTLLVQTQPFIFSKNAIKKYLSLKWFLKSQMFNVFLLSNVICIFMLQQVFRLKTRPSTINNLKDTIQRMSALKDGAWKTITTYLSHKAFWLCKLSLKS